MNKFGDRLSRAGKNVGAFLGGLIVALFLVEVALQIYNPFQFRVRGDEITLPTNRRYVTTGVDQQGIDTRIVHTKNELGFRGPPPPEQFDEAMTIVSVGGSTTENLYLSDGDHWTAILGRKLEDVFQPVWWNNAGLAGQSTYGHILLVRDYLAELKPDYVIYLVGINDVGRDVPGNFYEKLKRPDNDFSSVSSALRSLEEHSLVVSLMANAFRVLNAERKGIRPTMFHPTEKKTRRVSEERERKLLEEHRENHLPAYRRRLNRLVTLTREKGMEPILVTQPAFYGEGTDPRTGVNRGPLAFRDVNSRVMWQILSRYNQVTRSVADKHEIKLVDLARILPKDWTYFHDFIHYTKPGARRIGEIMFRELCPFFRRESRDHLIGECHVN